MLPLVIQIEKTTERTAETCAFARSPVRIGRNPLNDVELDDGYVSQWHGVIRFDEQHTTYLDLGSTNPSLVDGKQVERNVEIPITEGTDLRVGSFRLHVIRADAPPELFGARRKTAFARTGVDDASSVAATMFFGGDPAQLRSNSAMPELVMSSRVSGALSGPPVPAQPPLYLQPAPQRHSQSSRVAGEEPGRESDRPRPTGSPPPLPQRGAAASSPSRRLTSNAPTMAVELALPSRAVPAARRDFQPIAARADSQPVLPGAAQDPLRQAYEHYRSAWRGLLAELRNNLEPAASGRRSELLDYLVQQYPDIGREGEFRTLISELGISPLRTGVPEMEDWLRRLTDNMFPPPNSGINVALAMERIGEVLEVFATAFVEMRDAHERFCDEMSLERPPHDSLLQTTKNPRLALAYLLNPNSEGASKVEELARSMADFALHQVALVSAVVEGARGVLQELSPTAVDPKDARKEKRGFVSSLFSNEAQVRWQRYRGLFAEMMDEDRFTRRLFARPFARKYYAIMGGRRPLTPTE